MHHDVVARLADRSLEVVNELSLELEGAGDRSQDGANDRHALRLARDLDPHRRRRSALRPRVTFSPCLRAS